MIGTPPRLSDNTHVRNAASVFGEQHEALRAQKGADLFEVLVCDRNGTDETATLALDDAGSQDLKFVVAAATSGRTSR